MHMNLLFSATSNFYHGDHGEHVVKELFMKKGMYKETNFSEKRCKAYKISCFLITLGGNLCRYPSHLRALVVLRGFFFILMKRISLRCQLPFFLDSFECCWRFYSPYTGSFFSGISFRAGLPASFRERRGSFTGHSIPIDGSDHNIPRSSSGL